MFGSGDLLNTSDLVIRDGIHGTIRIHPHEMAVIDHPAFQRLRHICQNDILSLVFPGATHSRFAHSIGAMDVADRMFREMVRACLQTQSQPPSQVVLGDLQYLNLCLRLAMLMHDAGHGTFSHQMEMTPEVQALMSSPGLFQQLWEGVDTARWYPDVPQQLHHEHYSVRAAYWALTETGVEPNGIVAVTDVLSLMETTAPVLSPRFAEAAYRAWPLLTGSDARPPRARCATLLCDLLSAIVSGELDADKGDYILRDATHCSVSYGQIPLDALINAMRIGWDPDDEWMGLAILHKGLPNLEDFVLSRFQLYRNIYAHKTAAGFDLVLRRAIAEILASPSVMDRMHGFLSDITRFADLTDAFFWERFRDYASMNRASNAERILRRRKLRHLASLENATADQATVARQRLADRLGLAPGSIVQATSYARFSRIGNGYNAIRVLVKDPISGGRRLRQLAQCSDYFGKFSDVTLTHLYLEAA